MYIANFNFSVFELALAGVLFVFFVYQLIYYFRIINAPLAYNRKLQRTNTLIQSSKPGVSVIICARDEFDNLKKNLPFIIDQDYPDFEVIVVNDGSTDDTELLLTNLKETYPRLRSTFVPYGATNFSTKKLALTLGIKAAKYDWVLLTDADCVPESRQWIDRMARNFNQGVEFVLGFGPYLTYKTSLNKLITYDTLFIGLQYLGFALKGKPYMGVGRNLAYRKEVFFRLKGFASNLHLRSGDDDLLVNKAANTFNTKIEASKESITWSEPNKSLRNWLFQKKRHLSVSSNYSSGSRFRLSLEPMSRGLFYLSFIALLVVGNYISMITAGVLFLTRFIIQLIVINKASKHFGGRKYFLSILFFDIYLPLLTLYLMTFGKMGPKSKRIIWK